LRMCRCEQDPVARRFDRERVSIEDVDEGSVSGG
jgi:hypothetical protein